VRETGVRNKQNSLSGRFVPFPGIHQQSAFQHRMAHNACGKPDSKPLLRTFTAGR
jgi:hypothetical protein